MCDELKSMQIRGLSGLWFAKDDAIDDLSNNYDSLETRVLAYILCFSLSC
jgi:hypothetical protein